jgi:uncharacterized protein YgiM (DUF1202 family)
MNKIIMRKVLSIFILLLALTTLSSAQSNEQYLVNSKTLNLRIGPGKEFEAIATLSIGDAVNLIQKYDNSWWEVDFDGIQGYVYSPLLKIDPYSGWEKKNYQSFKSLMWV